MEEQAKINRELQFGVPIYEVDLPDFAAHKQALVDHFLALRKDSPGTKYSNQGGWHSSQNLHHSQEPSVQWLLQLIAQTGVQCIRHAGNVPENAQIVMASCWVVVNEAGDWNMPHAHFPSDWSGVCYIDLNDKATERTKAEKDGDIIFFDPLPLGPQYRRPPTITKTPVDGRVFVFPAYLVHMVAPHFEERPRIAMAYNFNLVPKQKAES